MKWGLIAVLWIARLSGSVLALAKAPLLGGTSGALESSLSRGPPVPRGVPRTHVTKERYLAHRWRGKGPPFILPHHAPALFADRRVLHHSKASFIRIRMQLFLGLLLLCVALLLADDA